MGPAYDTAVRQEANDLATQPTPGTLRHWSGDVTSLHYMSTSDQTATSRRLPSTQRIPLPRLGDQVVGCRAYSTYSIIGCRHAAGVAGSGVVRCLSTYGDHVVDQYHIRRLKASNTTCRRRYYSTTAPTIGGDGRHSAVYNDKCKITNTRLCEQLFLYTDRQYNATTPPIPSVRIRIKSLSY